MKYTISPTYLLSFFILLLTTSLTAQDRVTGSKYATRSEVITQNGMAATSHPLATQVALDILKSGGNAIDAAIAANATLGLMEPTGNGIGGDIFAIVWDAKTEQLYGLNGSGAAPQGMTIELMQEKGIDKIPAYGPLPVTIPGTVDGWFALHEKFGSKPMSDILQPAINYANSGFPVTELIAFYMELTSRRFKDYPNFADVWMPTGKTPSTGEVFKNPALANTLSQIAKGGRDAFYNSKMTDTMVSFLNEQGGVFTKEDFSKHQSEWIAPVSTNYRGYDVWELPPNGQGIAALQILNILEQYDIAKMGFGSTEYIHTFTEAKKLAWEDRAKYYADMKFADVPVKQLISKEYARQRKTEIKERAGRSYTAGKLKDGDTIYMTVSDKDGNMVSLIQSNFRGMGGGMVAPGLGFMFQDRGELFSLDKNHRNALEPGKRPFHTIIPAFITKDGKPYVSFGLMGGGMQPQGHAQIVVNLVDFGMNLQEAGDAPRMQHFGGTEPTDAADAKMTSRGKLALETGIDYQVIRDLMSKGHEVIFNRGGYGGYQAIMWDAEKGVYFGASESRKDGQAAGY